MAQRKSRNIRAFNDEWETITKDAEKHGMNASQYLRWLAKREHERINNIPQQTIGKVGAETWSHL